MGREPFLEWSRADFLCTPLYYICFDGNGNGLLFHMTQPTSRSSIKAIARSKPNISEN